ncbi:MAG: metal ABC transporter permease, partial [Cyanobacteria bacterium J06623_7]
MSSLGAIPVWNWFVEPLQYDFLVRAIWVSAFVGLVCAVLSCYITLKGWSLMGDAVSHAVVPGVVVAYALNIPFSVGAFIFGFGATVALDQTEEGHVIRLTGQPELRAQTVAVPRDPSSAAFPVA